MILTPSKFNLVCEDLNGDLLISNLLYGKHIRIPLLYKNAVKNILDHKSIQDTDDQITAVLKENKILVDSLADENRLYEYEKQEYLIKQSETLYLMIVPTQSCNFKCIYCWQENRKGRMSHETIENVKRFINREAQKCKKLIVEWFGGEPLLEYDTMIDIMKEVDSISKKYHIPYVSIVTTNGSLLTADRMKELLKYRVFSYQITLDGIRETHNATRPHKNPDISSYDMIMDNLKSIRDNIKQRFFEIIVRVNLSTCVEKHLDEFLDIYKSEFGHDNRFTLNFERVEDKGGARITNNSELIIDDYSHVENDVEKAIQSENHIHKFGDFHMGMYTCKVLEKNSYNINYNGDLFMCEMALDNEKMSSLNVIGHIHDDGSVEVNKEKMAWWRIPHENDCCTGCNIRPICFGGVCPLANNITCSCNLHNKSYLITNTMRVYAKQNFYKNVL